MEVTAPEGAVLHQALLVTAGAAPCRAGTALAGLRTETLFYYHGPAPISGTHQLTLGFGSGGPLFPEAVNLDIRVCGRRLCPGPPSRSRGQGSTMAADGAPFARPATVVAVALLIVGCSTGMHYRPDAPVPATVLGIGNVELLEIERNQLWTEVRLRWQAPPGVALTGAFLAPPEVAPCSAGVAMTRVVVDGRPQWDRPVALGADHLVTLRFGDDSRVAAEPMMADVAVMAGGAERCARFVVAAPGRRLHAVPPLRAETLEMSLAGPLRLPSDAALTVAMGWGRWIGPLRLTVAAGAALGSARVPVGGAARVEPDGFHPGVRGARSGRVPARRSPPRSRDCLRPTSSVLPMRRPRGQTAGSTTIPSSAPACRCSSSGSPRRHSARPGRPPDRGLAWRCSCPASRSGRDRPSVASPMSAASASWPPAAEVTGGDALGGADDGHARRCLRRGPGHASVVGAPAGGPGRGRPVGRAE